MKYYFRKKTSMLLFLVIAGVMFTGCGFRTFVNSNTNVLKKEDAMEFTVEKTAVDPITQIKIRTGMAEVELIPADDFYVEIDFLYWEKSPQYSIKDGILSFDDSDSFPNSYSISFNLDNSIKIYLPEETNLQKLFLKNSSGDVTIAGFHADDLDVTVSYGDFTMKNAAATKADINLSSGASKMSDFQVGELTFKNSYGNAKFTNINTQEGTLGDIDITMSSGNVNMNGIKSNTIDISNSYGNVTCEDVTAEEFDLSLSSGNLDVSKADLKKIEVNNSYGDVTLSLLGPAADYELDLNTSYGKIKVDGKSFEDHYVLENDGTRTIDAKLSSGDVEVTFRK